MKSLLTDRDALRRITNDTNDWYRIKNADGDVAEVYVYNEIGWLGVTAEEFTNELKAINADAITVRINSKGGSVFDGIAVYNALRTHPATITTQVDSLAASVASVIAQAGSDRVMVQHSQMMIHEAAGLAMGNADDIREFADLLDRQTDLIADIYATRSGADADEIRSLMAAETWMTADEAVSEGFADRVLDPSPNDETEASSEAADDDTDPSATLEAVDFSDLFG